MNTILVRRPSPRLAEGIVTHIERSEIDLDLARAQWAAYVATMEKHGWKPVEVPPADHCPDGVFIEDAVVMFGRLAVLTNPGHEVRRRELEGVGESVRDLGCRVKAIGDASTRPPVRNFQTASPVARRIACRCLSREPISTRSAVTAGEL